MRKPILTAIFCFCLGSFVWAQKTKIVKLLNQQFAHEQKLYDRAYEEERPTLIQPFEIHNDSLRFEFSIPVDPSKEQIRYTQRRVHLSDIESFIKDINVLFVTKEYSVQETVWIKDQLGNILSTEQNTSYLFFTELGKNFKDDSFRKKLLNAFQKAGYTLSSDYWFN